MGYNNTAKSINLQAALSLARQGIAVFPAGPDKKPLVTGWQKKATTDADQIERYWAKWPDAMPAMPTGRRNGIAVMDVDLKDAEDGKDVKDGAAALLAAGHDPDLLSTVQSETPSGGRHIFMRWSEGMGNSAAGLPLGVDVRGEGGYVIAPGAVNGKGAYRLVRGSLSDPLPEWPEDLRPRRVAIEAGEAQPSGRPFNIFAEALAAIPNDSAFDDRDDWLRIGMAINAETGGAAEGLDLFDDWSAQHDAYDSTKTEEAWRSFTSDRKGGVPGRAIFAEAERRGWRDVELETDLLNSCWSDEELAEIARKGEAEWKAELAEDPEAWNLVFPPKSPLIFLSPGDCADLPSRAYVIKGLLAERDVAAIVGAPGAGKSLIAPHLGYAVARGVEVFGRRTRQGGVLYVATEDSHGMRARVKALRDRHGDTAAFHVVEGVSDLLSKGSTDRKALRVAVEDRRPSLIVIDTLAFAFPGLEENDAKSMGAVVSVAKSLTKWGAAVILIHHDTKSGDQGLPRGHSILNGALDMSLHLKRDGRVVRGRPTKNRNGSADQELAFEIGVVDMGEDADGDPITVAICDEADAATLPKPGKPLSASVKAALEILEDLLKGQTWVEKSVWRAACFESDAVSGKEKADTRRAAYRRALEELTRRKIITSQGEQIRFTDSPEMLLGDDDVEQ